MKDRWKILLTSILVTLSLILIIGCVSASFKQVGLREYGILTHSIFLYSENNTVRTNGNYIVGIDKKFLTFPRGIISQQFKTMALTKDKSMVEINGFFAGRLIRDEVMEMFETYGFQYEQFLKASVEEFMRQAIEYYSLSQIIEKRQSVENNVRGLICLNLQLKYSWIHCDYVSLGKIGANIPKPTLLPFEVSFQKKYIDLLKTYITMKKKNNIFLSGGAQLLQQLEQLNGQFFHNMTSKIIASAGNNPNKKQILKYYISSPDYQVIQSEYVLDF